MRFILVSVGVLTDTDFSGGPRPVVEIGNRLKEAGHDVLLLTSRAGERLYRRMGLKAEYLVVDEREFDAPPGLLKVSAVMISRMVRAGFLLRQLPLRKGDVVLSVSDLLFEIFPLVFLRSGTPRIASIHLVYPNPLRGYRGAFSGKFHLPSVRGTMAFVQGRLAMSIIKSCSDLVLVLETLQPVVRQAGLDERKIVPLQPSVDLAEIDRVEQIENSYHGCWVGRYHPMKGCDDLVAIWTKVYQANSGRKLAVMGGVDTYLKAPVARSPAKTTIHLLGKVSDSLKIGTMKGSKVLIFPSYFEGWPVTVLEGMACGLPVIAYDLPVYRGVFGEEMIRVPVGDVDRFACEVTRLLDDANRRESLSRKARETAERFRNGYDGTVKSLLSRLPSPGY